MVEDIKLDRFPKESGAYLFKVDDEVIYVGSSKNLYHRMVSHRNSIRKGWNHGNQQEFYKFLQSNHFTVEFQLTDDYRQLEQELVEKYNPKYNSYRANTGLGASKGREAEYNKEYNEKYKEQKKQYRESHKEEIKQYQKEYHKTEKYQESRRKSNNKYDNQLCYYNGETLTLCALRQRLKRKGISNPTAEAKKYLV